MCTLWTHWLMRCDSFEFWVNFLTNLGEHFWQCTWHWKVMKYFMWETLHQPFAVNAVGTAEEFYSETFRFRFVVKNGTASAKKKHHLIAFLKWFRSFMLLKWALVTTVKHDKIRWVEIFEKLLSMRNDVAQSPWCIGLKKLPKSFTNNIKIRWFGEGHKVLLG